MEKEEVEEKGEQKQEDKEVEVMEVEEQEEAKEEGRSRRGHVPLSIGCQLTPQHSCHSLPVFVLAGAGGQ